MDIPQMTVGEIKEVILKDHPSKNIQHEYGTEELCNQIKELVCAIDWINVGLEYGPHSFDGSAAGALYIISECIKDRIHKIESIGRQHE